MRLWWQWSCYWTQIQMSQFSIHSQDIHIDNIIFATPTLLKMEWSGFYFEEIQLFRYFSMGKTNRCFKNKHTMKHVLEKYNAKTLPTVIRIVSKQTKFLFFFLCWKTIRIRWILWQNANMEILYLRIERKQKQH